MSILIKGIEMPKDREIYLRIDEKGKVYVCGSYPTELYKAVPVPPHGRLIDADALIYALETQDYSCAPDTLDEWTPMDMTRAEIYDIKAAPTIIPTEEDET